MMAGVLTAVAAAAGCTMKSQEAPPLTGPSEFGTSITLTATPDAITQDGGSQSLITITARDSKGDPLRSLSLRTDIIVGGVRADFGSLSARNVVTGTDGRANLVYTAPPPVPGLDVDLNTVVTIQATPSGTDFANSTPRIVSIRLLPIGVVRPPNGTPVANFTFSPATASENVKILFDASSSTDSDGRIVSYSWTFGDGDSGTGVTISRAYSAGGTYNVTLSVTDDRGLSASTTKAVTIGTGTNPVAAFTVSPTPPVSSGITRFDASLSVPAPGRRIVSYSWTFGDGDSATGVSPTHTFTAGGTYAVTLTVTDDIGKTGVSSQSLNVGTAGDPVAVFTTLPATPLVSENVIFNGLGSSAPTGRTIASYSWNFGDGTPFGNGVTTTHAYSAPGTYLVTLTVTDSTGRTGFTIKEVTVGAGGPTARLIVNPRNATINSAVQVDGSTSTAQPARTIVNYAFNFADGSPVVSGPSPSASHSYTATGSFTITLTVRDSAGVTASVDAPVTISASAPPVASFVYSPPSPVALGTNVDFNASASQAPQNAVITRYQWTFDGAPVTPNVCSAPISLGGPVFTATISTISHSFSAAGTFCVSLTVFDNQGGTNTTFRLITVQAAAGAASFVYSPTSPVPAGTNVGFDASASQAPAGQTITQYRWTFGDGSAPVSSPSPTGTTHTYAAPGTYTITLTLLYNQGGSNSTTRTITVQ